MKNDRLEELSDLVRQGVSLDFNDAIAVICYQEAQRREKDKAKRYTLMGKIRAGFAKLKGFFKRYF